ncbi:S-norcoclaurine synthase 1 [Artemisia annua]|uniref:S-norcoclaurine synthase 1 n=1 Tax=Artemisia annua TaxID=35608 RepID=A0A2U1Q6I4_ARTAN|nr:S-norcoclaurine synthase 1 [Artemisia annua]
MFGTLSEEVELKVSASKAWAIFGTVELAKLSVGKVLDAVDVVEGDGGTGTILKLKFKPGGNFTYYKEKFTKVDNQNMVKIAESVEGGYLDLGFNFYRVTFEIKDNPKDETSSSCIVKLIIEYDVKEEFASNASLINTEILVGAMHDVEDHLMKSN